MIARFWLGLELRRRWRSLLVLALLIAVAGGTVLTAFAGARRGATAQERLRARTAPANAVVLANTPGFDWRPIARLPEVAAISLFPVDYAFAIDGVHGNAYAFPPDAAMTTRMERPVVFAGRMFDIHNPHEAVMTPQFAAQQHKRIGDVLTMELPTAKEIAQSQGETPNRLTGPRVRMRIVGIVESPWYNDLPGSSGAIVMSAGILERYPQNVIGDPHRFGDNVNFVNALVRLRDVPNAQARLRDDVRRVTGRADIEVSNLDAQAEKIDRALAFEARCLAAFGLAALLAAIFLVGGAIARYATAGANELRILRALGLTPRQTVAAAAAGPATAGVLGALGAFVIAWLASARMPFGTASFLEPSRGIRINWAIVAPGVAAIALLVAGGAVLAASISVSAFRRPARARRSVIALQAARIGLPVPIVLGTRFALETGRGRSAVPVRPALVGAVVGTLGIVGAFTFAHGVHDASTNPARFGQTYQAVAYVGFNDHDFVPSSAVATFLRSDTGVSGFDVSRTSVATGPGGKTSVSLWEYGAGRKSLPSVVLSGRMPRAGDEVLLGPDSVSALHTRVGATVALNGSRGVHRYRVVGTGLIPAGPHNAYSDGGWLTTAGYERLFRGYKFHIALITLTDRGPSGVAALRAAASKVHPGFGSTFSPTDPIPEAAGLREVRALPFALGVFLGLLAIGAVGNALATAVRRRAHDLAVLRALGFTRWQCRVVVITQATVLALVGIVFGVPVGLAIGRSLWRFVADFTPLQYIAPTAVLALALVPPAALVLANALAAWPGRHAARLRVAQILRAE